MNTAQVIDIELNSILHSNLSELFYQRIGSTWFTDTVFLFGLLPLVIISFAFNAFNCLSVATNSKKLTKLPLYRFLFAYAANNCLITFILMFAFCSTVPHYFPFFFSIYSRIYRCAIVNYLVPTFYFVSKTLEIIILCERLSNFHPRLKKRLAMVHFAHMRTTIPIIYALCAALNAPFYWRRTIKSDDKLVQELAHFNTTRAISYCDSSPFIFTGVGWTILLLSMFVRDFLTFMVEVALSIWLVVSFRRFILSKLSVHNMPTNMLRVHTKSLTPHAVACLRFATFRKTTRTIMTFAVVSILYNMITSTLFSLVTVESSNQIVVNATALVICMLIIKLFLTFYVFYKLDKNIAEVFRIFRCCKN